MLRRSASSSSLGILAVVVPALLLLSSDLLFSLSLADPLAAADDSVTEADLLLNANATESNVSLSKPKEGSFADMIDKALENEFKESDQNEATDPGSFNNSVAGEQAVLETVARVKSKKNETKEEKSFQLHDVFNLDNDNRGEDTPTLIDRKDNVFIISNFKSKYPVLQLDLRLISDLVVVIVSATCGGIAFACAGQPVISGYLLAGSVIGPGGFNFVSEMVQVETVAQFGVIFLLFALGLEFSTAKLRVVRAVAVPGGLLQIFLFMCLCGITASLCGGKVSEGIFVGVFLSMSSTAVVLKFLMEKNSTNALHGQVTIGTLILQDCAVGLLFALLPVLGGTSGILQGVISMAKLMVTLLTFLAVLSISSRTCVPCRPKDAKSSYSIVDLKQWGVDLTLVYARFAVRIVRIAAAVACQLMKMSSSSSKCGKYDVFLSFRGDTSRNFTDYLAHTLDNHGFNVFFDENELTRGDPVTPALKQAIKDSRLAAIIFSRGYAESRWCLEELEEILARKETMGLMVLPIFYDIDPTDVRHQTREFEEAFRSHQLNFPYKVQAWKDALTAAAELAGEDFRATGGYEGRFVEQIVDEITRKLKNTYMTVAPNPVGIDSRVQEIGKYLADGGSDDVRIIGIWGMGGLGKTTVAKAIFNKYQDKFVRKSFLANVREEELVDLQNKLLSDVLRLRNIKVRRVDEATEEIKTRLRNLKVLVIVDDVDSVKQLEALAIKFYSFGPGSRIIITTRDQHLLKMLKANTIYHLPAMNKEEASELLCWHANNYPIKEFLQVPREVVDYCGGLPLALEILGSYLSGTSISEWKSKLEKFKSHHSREILNRLEISFDELADDDLKAIFLDVSCFFAGMNKDYVMKILDGCDLYPEIRISVLHERCLVTTNEDLTLVMHDLVRDMGRYIVHAESPDVPGKRSRLWHHDDVIDVLRDKSGTEAIQGLTLDLQESDETSFSTEAFRNMHSLRLLKLNYVKLTGSYNNLPNELRWLCWHGFPLEVIPEDFDHPNIVVIDLSYSKLTRVWADSVLLLEKLKFLNLSHSHNLTRSPDFSKTPNLERLILKDCKNLQAIPALPTNLEILEADECIALEKMPDFSEMSRMRELHLNHSPKLSEILGLDKPLNCMTSIHMEGCTNLTASFKEGILQGWSTSGNGGLFLPGNEIPSWFTPVDPQGEIAVPQSFGCDLKALTVCIIYSSDDSKSGGSLRIRVANYSQNTVFLISPMRATVLTCHENYLWLGHLSNNKLNVKGGDKINVGAHFVGPGTTDDIHLRVKKIGINLEKEKLINEYALGRQFMPYSSECKEDGNHKAGHGYDSSHENQSRKRLRLDPSVERNAEETDEFMQEGSSMG